MHDLTYTTGFGAALLKQMATQHTALLAKLDLLLDGLKNVEISGEVSVVGTVDVEPGIVPLDVIVIA